MVTLSRVSWILTVLDYVMKEIVNSLEYHILLTPAAVLCLVLGRWSNLEKIQARMDDLHRDHFVKEDTTESVEVVEDIIEDLLATVMETIGEGDMSSILETPGKQSVESLVKGSSAKKNESGYLSELETSTVGDISDMRRRQGSLLAQSVSNDYGDGEHY